MTARLFVLATRCCLLALPGLAGAIDSQSVRFQHLGRDDGLSQSFVYSVVQDRQGFMWFGTQEGLNRYDGFDFKIFAHDPDDPLSISDESVRTVFEDSSGTLWIGTDAGGLSRYDPDKETFTNYLHDPADARSIADNRVRAIYEDSAGRLWIGTDGAGLDRFDRETQSFEHFPPDPSSQGGLIGAHVWSLLEDSEGVLWVATTSGLSRLDETTQTFVNYLNEPADSTSISDDFVRVLYEDSNNNLWVGTNSGGLNKFDPSAETFERFVNDPEDADSISANRINALYEDSSGVLWIGTVKGLNAWNAATRGFERYYHRPEDRYSIAHDNVLTIFEDRGGLLWTGTYNGLSVWNQAMRAMLHYKHDVDDPNSLSADTVTSFAEDSGGTVWIGTFGGGLNSFDPSTTQFGHLRHDPTDAKSLSSDRVMALLVDSNNELWVGTRGAGLNRHDAQSGSFIRYRNDANEPSSLSADGVTYILEDSTKGLWIATFGGGLNYFDRSRQEFRRYRNDPDDATTLSSDRVLVLFEDAKENLWIGTYGGGLNRFDPSTGTFTRILADPDRVDGLSGNEIYMIQEDARGDLWIGIKGSGLNRWARADREAGKASFQRFTELDGLPSATVYSGIWDEAGFLWLSSSHGLSRLDTETLDFKNYDTSHGLQGDEFNLAAGFRASSGQLYFGGMNGFNAFQPEQLAVNTAAPPVAITRLLDLNEPIDLGESRSSGTPVELDYRQNVIGFEFAALDYAAPQKNRFMYKLEGLDSEWNDIGTKRQVTYANLPSGNFTFRVKAANNDGVWSEQDATLDIRMNPAPWQTWWAYLFYLLVVAALLVVAFRAHARGARQQAAAKHVAELRVIEARLIDAQRIARIGNWEWSIANNQLWWSDEIYRLFQVEKTGARLSYDAYIQRVHPDDRKLVNAALDRAVQHHELYSVDIRILQKDGSIRFVHEQAEVTRDADGQPVKMSGTVHDITERKHAENAVRHRADFEALLAKLSSELIRSHPGDIALQLEEGLKLVGLTYEVDAINLRWQNNGDDDLTSVYRWTRGAGSKNVERLNRATYPWTTEKMQEGEPVIVDDVEDLPAPAATDKMSYRQRGITSFVVIPLLIDQKL
ncbi:MAG: two-component regulator propeller domain-containing protein, partial [Woeseiaceae bacterium]